MVGGVGGVPCLRFDMDVVLLAQARLAAGKNFYGEFRAGPTSLGAGS
jgi:hypothetical protein